MATTSYDRSTARELVNQVFLPPDQSPWALFPRDLLTNQGLHRSTLLFFHANADILLALIWRKEPTSPRYEGSFPLSKSLLEWISVREHSDEIASAFMATIESQEASEIITMARASEVADRFLGRVEPRTSSASSEPFYWADGDLFPARVSYPASRRFRMLEDQPSFLREQE